MGDQEHRISVVIPHVPGPNHDKMLKECVDSLEGYDELIVVTNEIGTLGFTRAVNMGLKLATGDYMMVVNNDTVWTEGTLDEMCVPNVVTSPKLGGNPQYFWGCFFVIPRSVLDKVGLLDEQFYLYCSDTDYVLRCKEERVKLNSIETCNVDTKGGRTTRTDPNRFAIATADEKKFFTKWGRKPDQSI
jgi:O-antigen biosynthesis protein